MIGARAEVASEPVGGVAPPREAPWWLEPVAAAALTFVGFLLLFPHPAYVTGAYGDDSVYVALGKAIAAGAGYREIFTLGSPIHVKYPPGLPALLAAFWRVFGDVDGVLAAARVANAAAIAISAGLLWRIGRSRLGLSAVTTAVFAISPLFLDSMLQYASLPLSEPYMLLGWTVATWLSLRVGDASSASEKTGLSVLLGLVLGFTILFRTQAAFLLPAAAAVLLLKRAGVWQALWCFATGSLPAVLWWSASSNVGAHRTAVALTSPTYLQDFLVNGATSVAFSASQQALFAARGYLGWFAPFFAEHGLVGRAVVGSLLAAAVFGGVRVARRLPELVLFPAASVALLLLWPYVSDRFVLATLPFLGLLAAYRIELELRRLNEARRRTGAVLLLIAASAVALRQAQVRRDGLAAGPPSTWAYNAPAFLLPWTDRFIRAASQEVRDHTTPDDRVLVDRPSAVFLYTGRTTVPPDPGERIDMPPGAYLAEQILAGNVTVAVVGSPDFRSGIDAAAVQSRCPGALEPVRETESGVPMYRVRRDEPCLSTFLTP